MNPAHFHWQERDEIIAWAKRVFGDEIFALEDADGSGHTPHLISYLCDQQSSDMPYPGGYIHIILMSFVPGENPARIYSNLTADDLQIIRKQLTQTLE